MTKYDKLIRDKIPEVLDKKGVSYKIHAASDEEYQLKLREKLQEEVAEYLKDMNPKELADILEVIHALTKSHKLTIEELENIRIDKFNDRGGFDKKLILEETE